MEKVTSGSMAMCTEDHYRGIEPSVCHVLSSFADSGRKMAALSLLQGLGSSEFRQKLVVLEGEPGEREGVRYFGRREGIDLRLLFRLRARVVRRPLAPAPSSGRS